MRFIICIIFFFTLQAFFHLPPTLDQHLQAMGQALAANIKTAIHQVQTQEKQP